MFLYVLLSMPKDQGLADLYPDHFSGLCLQPIVNLDLKEKVISPTRRECRLTIINWDVSQSQ